MTHAGLEIDHPALNDFKLSQKDSITVEPELINWQLRNFQETKWMGHCVLLWTLCNWKELPIDWVNRTTLSMGGKAGHTNLFYGPMVISVLRQDMLIQNDRTPDHVQMRTLRQVADYVQMVDDNPCVGNPSRFLSVPDSFSPEPDLVPIPGVKINDEVELDVMGPFGMALPKEEVFVSISSRTQAQGPAAVPFVLGLKWYVRTAKLDIIVESDETKITATIEPDLIWAQWEIELLPADPDSPGQKKANVVYAHHDRSMVVVQAGGAPLRIEHINALTQYLHENQEKAKNRAAISKEGFAAFWQKKYGSSDIASPYDLEDSYSVNLFEDDADVVLAFEAVAASEEIKMKVMHFNAVRAETLIKRLIMTYPDDQVVMIVETLISYWKGQKSLEDMQAEVVSADPVSGEKLKVVEIVAQLARAHKAPELHDITRYIDKYIERSYLAWFNRDGSQSDGGAESSDAVASSTG